MQCDRKRNEKGNNCRNHRPSGNYCRLTDNVRRAFSCKKRVEIVDRFEVHRIVHFDRCTSQVRQKEDVVEIEISGMKLGLSRVNVQAPRRNIAAFDSYVPFACMPYGGRAYRLRLAEDHRRLCQFNDVARVEQTVRFVKPNNIGLIETGFDRIR
jgi:hypothetical protein